MYSLHSDEASGCILPTVCENMLRTGGCANINHTWYTDSYLELFEDSRHLYHSFISMDIIRLHH